MICALCRTSSSHETSVASHMQFKIESSLDSLHDYSSTSILHPLLLLKYLLRCSFSRSSATYDRTPKTPWIRPSSPMRILLYSRNKVRRCSKTSELVLRQAHLRWECSNHKRDLVSKDVLFRVPRWYSRAHTMCFPTPRMV